MIAGLLTVATTFTSAFQRYRDQQLTKLEDKLTQAKQCNDEADIKLTFADGDAAEKLLKRAVDLELGLPNKTDCNLLKAATLRRLGYISLRTANYPEAASKLEEARQLLSGDPRADKSLLIRALANLAEAKARIRDFAGALKTLQTAKELCKDNPSELKESLEREAQIKEAQKKFDSAENL